MPVFPQKARPPFYRRLNDGRLCFHCVKCSTYKAIDQFYVSYLKRRYRQCTQCVKGRENKMDDINRLRRQLYKALHQRGEKGFAQRITTKFIQGIIDLKGAANASTVKQIRLPKQRSKLLEFDLYELVFFS